MIRPEGSFITGWGRTVAIFVFHARKYIAKAGLQNEEFLGHDSHFWRVFPNQQHYDLDCHHFNDEYAGVKLQMKAGNLRYDSYTDFKCLLKSFKPYVTGIHKIKHPNTRYSFVIRSFMEARSHEHNFDRINELANYCANYTANDPPLSEYWIGAIKGLCFLSVESPNPDKPYPFREMARQIDVSFYLLNFELIKSIFRLLTVQPTTRWPLSLPFSLENRVSTSHVSFLNSPNTSFRWCSDKTADWALRVLETSNGESVQSKRNPGLWVKPSRVSAFALWSSLDCVVLEMSPSNSQFTIEDWQRRRSASRPLPTRESCTCSTGSRWIRQCSRL